MTQQTLDPRGSDEVPVPDRSPAGPSAPGASVTIIDGIRAHKLLVVLCGLAVALLAAAFTWISSPGSRASGQLGLVYPASGNVLLPLPTGDATMARYTSQRALFAKSDVVLDKVVAAVPDVTRGQVRSATSVTASRTANAIVVTVTSGDSDQALAIAQAVMDSYRSATSEDVIERSDALADGWEARGDFAKAEQVRIDGTSFGDGVEFEVSPSLEPQSRRLLNKEVALGLLVGLGFGALLAWYREDARRKRPVTEEAA